MQMISDDGKVVPKHHGSPPIDKQTYVFSNQRSMKSKTV